MAGVHGLEHVQRLAAAALADDYAVRPHAQGVLDEVSDVYFALAFDVGRTRLQAHYVLLTQLQFCGVLDGYDSLAVWQEGA